MIGRVLQGDCVERQNAGLETDGGFDLLAQQCQVSVELSRNDLKFGKPDDGSRVRHCFPVPRRGRRDQ
jgi:hypothetical protein